MAKKEKTLNPVLKNRCRLCGKTRNLTKTECCGNWICNDEDKYVMFSYARNSCHRNHKHYTLCAHHHTEEHDGDWKSCAQCRDSFVTEDYVWYGTNEYNFEKLPDPPAYEPTKCSQCATIISLSQDEYSILGKDYFCSECTDKRIMQRAEPTKVREHRR
jgi:hypothetical protein